MSRILIVEDSPTQAQSLKLVLESEQFEAAIATTGEAALERLGQESFDLVVSDIVMPGMSGYDLCRAIKSSHQSRHIPVILLTSLRDPMDIIEGLECGADNFMTKPYDADQLVERMRRMLENKHLRKEGRLRMGVEIAFLGKTFTITSEREQILDLLISTFEDIVRTNQALEKSQAELAEAKAEVEKYARLVEHKLDVSEEALRESEALFRGAFEDAGHGMALVSLDGRFMRVNSALCRFLGYSEQELIDRDVGSTSMREDGDRARKECVHLIAEGKGSFRLEKRYVHKDGKTVWGDLTVALVTESGGKPKHLVMQVQDITAQKAAERELRHTMRALKVISGGNQALVRAHDEETLLRDMCRVVVDRAGYRMAWVGYPANDRKKTVEPATMYGDDRGYFDDAPVVWSDTARGRGPTGTAIRTGEVSVSQDIANDPRVKPWKKACVEQNFRSMAAFPLKADDHTFGALTIVSSEVGAFQDEEIEILSESALDMAYGIVTLRNEQERVAGQSTIAKLSMVVEQSPSMVIITNRDAAIEYVNPKFTAITGYPASDVVGENPRFLKSGETPSEAYEEMWAALLRGREWRGLMHNKRKDGSYFWADAVISGICDAEDDEITHFVAIEEDITERLEMERRLIQSEKLESLGALAGGIAHDFNNMLLPIRSLSQMTLKDLAEDSRAHARLSKVVEAADRAHSLVQRILTFSRAEEAAKPKALNFPAVVGDAVELLRSTLPKTVTMSDVIDHEAGYVVADPAQLQSIILNLGKNAADAMEGRPGNLAIEVSRWRQERKSIATIPQINPGEYLRLSVADTGSGIPDEVKAKIFEPFFTTKGVGEGTGLGLAMVHGIVSKAGGGVAVESTKGEGTTFDIYWPVAKA